MKYLYLSIVIACSGSLISCSEKRANKVEEELQLLDEAAQTAMNVSKELASVTKEEVEEFDHTFLDKYPQLIQKAIEIRNLEKESIKHNLQATINGEAEQEGR